MESSQARLEMGVILCKHCETEIGTFDSNKVTIYYSDCQEKDCLENRGNSKSDQELSAS